MIKLNIKNKSTIFHSCTCTLYIYVNTINGPLCRELNAHLSRCHGPYTFNLQRRESIVRKKNARVWYTGDSLMTD